MNREIVERAKEHFGKLVEDQLGRVERMRAGDEWIDYAALETIKVSVLGGDTGSTGEDFVNYLMVTMKDSRLEERWRAYQARVQHPRV